MRELSDLKAKQTDQMIPLAKYAGLGTIGASHNLLTAEFGPRVLFVSVFTSSEIPPDPMMGKELCIKCQACAKCCPKKAIRMRADRAAGDAFTISLGIYGRSIRQGYIHFFDPAERRITRAGT